MFIKGLARVGEYQSRGWKMEDWYKYPNIRSTLIPGVSNTTAAAAAGGTAVAAGGLYLLGKFMKWW